MSKDKKDEKIDPNDAAHKMGKMVAEYYRSLLQNGVEEKAALEITKEYMRQLTIMFTIQSNRSTTGC